MTKTILVAGVSARALATSAARAGWRVLAVDAFNDLDLRATAEAVQRVRMSGDWGRGARAAAGLRADAFAYASGLEHAPAAVERFAHDRRLLGNLPEVLAAIRDPLQLHRVLRAAGCAGPETRASAPPSGPPHQWLLKPRLSGGGGGVHPWARQAPVPRTHVLQRRVPGRPGSLLFVADGRRVAPIALTRMLVGVRTLGASGFRYCGTLVGGTVLGTDHQVIMASALAAAAAVTQAYGLRGINGIDFVAHDGEAHVVEVNPRWTAAVECVEQALGCSLFGVHEAACAGRLPRQAATLLARVTAAPVHGKAYVFARHDAEVPQPAWWGHVPWMADVPPRDQRLRRGHAVCTVFATGLDRAACRRRLMGRAGRIHAALAASRVLHFVNGRC
jgi:predicted ATP-grasp superfamily ATP-dependent carboligase